MNQEEIQRRIQVAKERHEARLTPIIERKKRDKEIAQKLTREGVLLAYIDVKYTRSKTKTTKISVAVKETRNNGNVEIDAVYTILSNKDRFSKAAARKILASRLEDQKTKQRIRFTIAEKAVNNSEKMFKAIKEVMDFELATNKETVPSWLSKGIKKYEEIN